MLDTLLNISEQNNEEMEKTKIEWLFLVSIIYWVLFITYKLFYII